MKFPKKHKLHKACDPNTHRSPRARDAIRWNAPLRRLEATDGRILAVLPMLSGPDESHSIPAEAWKAATTGTGLGKLEFEAQTVTPTIKGSPGPRFPVGDPSKHPDVSGILNSASTGVPAIICVLDVRRLANLAAALGSSELILEIRNPKDAIFVRARDEGNEAYGLIMPLSPLT